MLMLWPTVTRAQSSMSGTGSGGGTSTFGPVYSVGGGTAQAQTVAPSTPVTNATLVPGYQICWAPNASNTAAGATLAGSGTSTFSATVIVNPTNPSSLIAGDISTSAIACAIYDGSVFELQNPQAGVVATKTISVGTAPTVCGTATACVGFTEAATTCTPTVGQDCQRADSVTHKLVCSFNGGAETACAGGAAALSALTPATASNTIANGNNPQIWNWAQTTDAQDGMAFGETSAATGGTLTSGLANQALVSVSTASGSTSTPLEVVQGAVTGTTAFPAAQFESTWNNAGLVGQGIVENIVNTASAANSMILNLMVGGTTQFSADKAGQLYTPLGYTVGTPGATSNVMYTGGLQLANGSRINWYNAGTTQGGSADLGLSRVAAGVLGAGNGVGADVSATFAATNYRVASTLLISGTAPTIAAGGCGGAAASIIANNGTGAFKIGVGTTPGSACTITMPAATTGWNCHADDITTQSASVFVQKQTGAESTTSVTITNFNTSAAATAYVASDVLKVTCNAD